MKTLLQKLMLKLAAHYQKSRTEAQKVLQNKKRLFLFLTGFCIIAFAGYYIANSLVIGYGNSLRYHLFLKISGKPEVGKYVTIKTPESDPFAKGVLITKEVGCTSGQHLRIEGDDYYCNGRYLGKALHRATDGRTLIPFNPCGSSPCDVVVPEKTVFAVGHHPRSYDSKYMGFIPEEWILCVLTPLF